MDGRSSSRNPSCGMGSARSLSGPHFLVCTEGAPPVVGHRPHNLPQDCDLNARPNPTTSLTTQFGAAQRSAEPAQNSSQVIPGAYPTSSTGSRIVTRPQANQSRHQGITSMLRHLLVLSLFGLGLAPLACADETDGSAASAFCGVCVLRTVTTHPPEGQICIHDPVTNYCCIGRGNSGVCQAEVPADKCCPTSTTTTQFMLERCDVASDLRSSGRVRVIDGTLSCLSPSGNTACVIHTDECE